MTISKENSKNHTHTEVKTRNPAAHILKTAWLPPGTPESGSVPPSGEGGAPRPSAEQNVQQEGGDQEVILGRSELVIAKSLSFGGWEGPLRPVTSGA